MVAGAFTSQAAAIARNALAFLQKFTSSARLHTDTAVYFISTEATGAVRFCASLAVLKTVFTSSACIVGAIRASF